jgi:hypothetical protein
MGLSPPSFLGMREISSKLICSGTKPLRIITLHMTKRAEIVSLESKP